VTVFDAPGAAASVGISSSAIFSPRLEMARRMIELFGKLSAAFFTSRARSVSRVSITSASRES